MKWLFASVICFKAFVMASECEPFSFELKAEYFVFQNEKMRKIYGKGALEVEASSTYSLSDTFQIYGSVGYLETKGKSINFDQKTTFWKVPVDLGLRAIFNLGCSLDWYLTVGPRYFYAHQKNKSSYVNKKIGKSGVGGFANSGFNYYLSESFFVDLFASYSYEPICFSTTKKGVYSKTVQVGGYSIGGGLGYTF